MAKLINGLPVPHYFKLMMLAFALDDSESGAAIEKIRQRVGHRAFSMPSICRDT